MSIESQAEFFYRSVCDYDSSIYSGIDVTESIVAGFAEFSALLRAVYRDWRSFETSTVPSVQTKIGIMSDDLENFHNLTYAVLCLSGIAKTGELRSEGETQYLHVSKDAFKGEYRKTTPVAFLFALLEKHGFYFTYFKGEKETVDYKRCDNFNVYYENGGALFGAVKYIADRLSEPTRKQEFSKEAADIHSKMPGDVTFMTADYYLILTGKINQNPLHESILRTLGLRNELWQELVALLRDEYGLGPESVDISCNPYVFPEKTVVFKQRKKVVCKFEIRADRLTVWLSETFESAKKLILDKENLPPEKFKHLASFTCSAYCGCGYCDKSDRPKVIVAIDLKS